MLVAMMEMGSCGSSKSEAEIAHSEMCVLSLPYIILYRSVQKFLPRYFEMITPVKTFNASLIFPIFQIFLFFHCNNGQMCTLS